MLFEFICKFVSGTGLNISDGVGIFCPVIYVSSKRTPIIHCYNHEIVKKIIITTFVII